MNVIENVVKNDYCIGCGVCAGVCPSNNLNMDWSSQGELIPYTNTNCKDNCSICLDVCPFYDHEINQDDIAHLLFSKIPKIKYNKYTGYYLNCYVGFQKDERKRLKSASGGLATSFLSSLLEKKIVDKIIAVGPSENKDRLFDFKIVSNSEEAYSCTGSVYYPVEISRVLKEILKNDKDDTYAIIALPCVVYSLRLAIEKIPKLKRKIKTIISLTCGQLQNRFCTELIALESGIKINDLSNIDFRRKTKENPASIFMHVATDKNGNEGIPQFYNELPFHLWHYHYFKQNSCNFCDDVFGEVADITFMDAWLPEYIQDFRGTSIVIARTSMAKKLLENNPEQNLNHINIQKVIESQNGAIHKKKVMLKGRLFKNELSGILCPKKRLKPDAVIYQKNQELIEITEEIQKLSKKLWPKYRQDTSTINFWNDMKTNEVQINEYKRKNKDKLIFTYFNLILNCIKKIIETKK